MSHVLKRSISSNAINTVRRRSGSFSGSICSGVGGGGGIPLLSRSLSQTSLLTPQSPSFATTASYKSTNYSKINLKSNSELENESFNDFMRFVSGEQYYNKVSLLWENLPSETRDKFVARAINCRTGEDEEGEVSYEDIRDLFDGQPTPTRSSFMQYRKRLGPHFRNNAPDMEESVISQIVGEIYNNELDAGDKLRLKKEAKEIYMNTIAARMEAVRGYVSENQMTFHRDPIVDRINNWKCANRNDDVDVKIKQLNRLIKTLDIKEEDGVDERKKNGKDERKKKKKKKKKKKLVSEITNRSKAFVKRFKRNKSEINIYRTPVPI